MIDFDFASLRTIGFTQAIAAELPALGHQPPGTCLARITEVHRDSVTVHDGVGEHAARALGGGEQLAVGDWVLVQVHANGEYWLSARVPPTTHLARRSSTGRRQSLASNIDTALLVMGLDHDFNLRRLERYIALVRTAGIDAVAVLTKADIAADRMQELRERLPPSIPAFAINAHDPGAVLDPWLGAGQTLVLLGTSGAGKSTLTNALTGSGQQTGGVRHGDSRGRHTTTSRSLHLCTGGACIIDTPGLRTWSPDADEEAIAASFDDIDALAVHCQFRDCSHGEEPGCAVRDAVDSDRLRNYHKLLREARRSSQTPLDRIAERAKWKVMMKQAGLRGKQKRE